MIICGSFKHHFGSRRFQFDLVPFFGTLFLVATKLLRVAEHAQCDSCSKYKQSIGQARTADEKTRLQRQYSGHLLSQWLDRQFYWAVRSLSQSFFSTQIHLVNKWLMSN